MVLGDVQRLEHHHEPLRLEQLARAADVVDHVRDLKAAGAPVAEIDLPEPSALGAEFVRWEVATAIAGALAGINPFDEPNVQQAKDATRALLAGGMLASGLEGVGMHARARLRLPGLRTVDGLLGAGLTACVGLAIAWIIGAVALVTSGSAPLRRDIQRSAILRELNRLLPPSGPILPSA